MKIEMNSIIEPKPNLDTLSKEESMWHVELPSAYREFIMEYNGAIPINKSFVCRNHEYAILNCGSNRNSAEFFMDNYWGLIMFLEEVVISLKTEYNDRRRLGCL